MFFQNYVNIDGNLCGDIEIKESKKGTKYCRFSICYNENMKDPQTKEWKSVPNFFNCVAWNHTAEICSRFKKGDAVSIIGKLNYSEWTDESGNKNSKVSIIVNAIRKFSFEKSEPVENTASEELDELGNEAFEIFQ